MTLTTRFAHLADTPLLVGDTVAYGSRIGTMGNTGSEKTGLHLHADTTEGENNFRYSLADMMAGKPRPNKKQLDYFIDFDLFKHRPLVTTGYLDPDYKAQFGKDHPAYDVVPYDRLETNVHFGIFWNRTRVGRVIRIDYGDPGYGTCVYIAFDVEVA